MANYQNCTGNNYSDLRSSGNWRSNTRGSNDHLNRRNGSDYNHRSNRTSDYIRGRGSYGNNHRGNSSFNSDRYGNGRSNSYVNGNNFDGAGGYKNNHGNDSWYSGTNFSTKVTDFSSLAPIQKDFYTESTAMKRRAQIEIDKWYAEKDVTLRGENIPRPIFEFNEGNFPAPIQNLLMANFANPTVIQSLSWPVALSGHDLIAIAQTGSGKTLGFTIPAIIHTLNQPMRQIYEGPTVVILLPTRELAQQVETGAKKFCEAMDLSLTCLYGGASKGPQGRALRKGVDIIVATPGRLNDFLTAGETNMNRCSFLVLDEADRMLDMGFEPQIRSIISQIRPDRQTLMFSATWPKEVQALAAGFQNSPIFLNVGSLELSANHSIEQKVEVLDELQKESRLYELLQEIFDKSECKTIIFTETKKRCEEIARGLKSHGYKVAAIHGDKAQADRDWALAQFRDSKVKILLATDVAARGLDVKDIRYVVNYDYPNNSEDYVHRIGRTGRSNNSGTSYTFFTRKNAPKAKDLIKVLEEANQTIPERLKSLVDGSSLPMSFGGHRNNKRFYAGSLRDGGVKRGRFDGNTRGYGYRGGKDTRW